MEDGRWDSICRLSTADSGRSVVVQLVVGLDLDLGLTVLLVSLFLPCCHPTPFLLRTPADPDFVY